MKFDPTPLKERLETLKLKAFNAKTTSDKYATIDTESISAKVYDTLHANGIHGIEYNLRVCGGWKNTKHFMEFTFNNNVIEVLGDQVKPKIIIENSFNGESAFRVSVGLLRLVCTNGLMVGESFFKQRIIHVQGVTLEEKLDELEYQIVAAVNYIADHLDGQLQSLNQPVSEVKAYEIVNDLKFSKRLTERIKGSIQNPRRVEDEGDTLWHLYNIINEELRDSSRSEFAEMQKNVKLMDKVIKLAA